MCMRPLPDALLQPSRVLAPAHLMAGSLLSPKPAQVLVLDEADLLLSYGYEEDVAALAPQVRCWALQSVHRWSGPLPPPSRRRACSALACVRCWLSALTPPHTFGTALQVPRSCQCMLMSATSSADVDRLTKLVLHNPLALNLLGAAGSEVRRCTALGCMHGSLCKALGRR